MRFGHHLGVLLSFYRMGQKLTEKHLKPHAYNDLQTEGKDQARSGTLAAPVESKWPDYCSAHGLFLKQTGSKEHTTEGAGERQAGVMWDLPSSVLHICRVHREDVLRKKQTHEEFDTVPAGSLSSCVLCRVLSKQH